MTADIMNAYITAPNKEKIWTLLSPKSGKDGGRKAIVVCMDWNLPEQQLESEKYILHLETLENFVLMAGGQCHISGVVTYKHSWLILFITSLSHSSSPSLVFLLHVRNGVVDWQYKPMKLFAISDG